MPRDFGPDHRGHRSKGCLDALFPERTIQKICATLDEAGSHPGVGEQPAEHQGAASFIGPTRSGTGAGGREGEDIVIVPVIAGHGRHVDLGLPQIEAVVLIVDDPSEPPVRNSWTPALDVADVEVLEVDQRGLVIEEVVQIEVTVEERLEISLDGQVLRGHERAHRRVSLAVTGNHRAVALDQVEPTAWHLMVPDDVMLIELLTQVVNSPVVAIEVHHRRPVGLGVEAGVRDQALHHRVAHECELAVHEVTAIRSHRPELGDGRPHRRLVGALVVVAGIAQHQSLELVHRSVRKEAVRQVAIPVLGPCRKRVGLLRITPRTPSAIHRHPHLLTNLRLAVGIEEFETHLDLPILPGVGPRVRITLKHLPAGVQHTGAHANEIAVLEVEVRGRRRQ